MDAMSIVEALVLGVVEGVTEFLPISSTAHLMFTSELLSLAQSAFVKSFEVAIQLGAILAVVVLYWRSFLNIQTVKYVAVAFVPTVLVGALLYPFIKSSLIGNVPVALAALAAGGLFLVIFERWRPVSPKVKPSDTQLSYRNAFWVGLSQSVAVVPGVSRSAATIIGGLLLGLDRRTIVEFSFLLAVPTMAAATGYDLYKNAGAFAQSDFTVLSIGFVTSFVVALMAIKWLLSFVRTHDFTAFGVYRIAAAALFFFILL